LTSANDEARLAQLEDHPAAAPGFWDDAESARAKMQELATVRDRVQTWQGLHRRVRDVVELVELSMAEGDESAAESAAADITAAEKQLEALEFQLQLSGPYDQRSAILAVHAGAGGTDSQDWADMLLRLYLRWAERHGYSTDILDMTEGEEAGIKSVTVEITGPYAFGYLKSERASTARAPVALQRRRTPRPASQRSRSCQRATRAATSRSNRTTFGSRSSAPVRRRTERPEELTAVASPNPLASWHLPERTLQGRNAIAP